MARKKAVTGGAPVAVQAMQQERERMAGGDLLPAQQMIDMMVQVSNVLRDLQGQSRAISEEIALLKAREAEREEQMRRDREMQRQMALLVQQMVEDTSPHEREKAQAKMAQRIQHHASPDVNLDASRLATERQYRVDAQVEMPWPHPARTFSINGAAWTVYPGPNKVPWTVAEHMAEYLALEQREKMQHSILHEGRHHHDEVKRLLEESEARYRNAILPAIAH